MRAYRYSRWDGTQAVEPFTAEDLMQHLSDRILDDQDLWSALRDMLQRGAQLPSGRRMSGLRDLLDRLRERRQDHLQRHNLDSVMEDIKRQLEQVIQTEREGIQRRLDQARSPGDTEQGPGERGESGERGQETEPGEDAPSRQPSPARGEGVSSSDPSMRQMLENMAQRHLSQLDALPPGAGGQIQALRDYDFMDPEARQQFEELLNTLRQQILDSYFQNIKQALGAMTPEMMAQLRDMVSDLNDLMDAHRHGDDSGFQDFMEKWGQFFPEGIESVEQLAQHLNNQMAAMRSLMDSMTADQRRELEQMLAPLFQDGGLQEELSELMWNLGRLFPDDRGERMDFSGDEPVTLQEALRLMGDMRGLEELEQELMEAVKTNDASRIDADEIGRLVGDEARQMAQELQDFVKMLEEAGFIHRNGNKWALTPRAMKKIGERALEEIFGRIDRGLSGDHSLARWGWGVERLDETKTYTFGDPFAIDTQATVMNALRRQAREDREPIGEADVSVRRPARQGREPVGEADVSGRRLLPGPPWPLQLNMDDFEVYRSSSLNQCSTVIMLDMSYSMLMRGRFQAGRKVALALDSLIRTKFPRDTLHVVAFSYFVLPLEPYMLLDDYWIDPRGTDFPEALRQARQILGKRKGGTKQVIMITDGEPHVNTVGYGWSGMTDGGGWSMRQAMEDTLREVGYCTREGITVNTFMLDTQPVVSTFIKALTKINNGRIFFADPSELGEYLIVDYVKNRRSAS